MLEVRALPDGDLDDVLALYNRAAGNRYSGQINAETWQQVIAAKAYYRPDLVLIAYEAGAALGYVHLCHGPNDERSAPDPALGSVEGLFFHPDRPDVGRALLQHALGWHRAHGAHQVLGWSSFSGYPLYRGLWLGLEPMAFSADRHVVDAFHAAGFAACQHSVEMVIDGLGPVEDQRPSLEAEFRRGPWLPDKPWDRETWLGLAPFRNYAIVEDEEVCSCLYSIMPRVSETQGEIVGCIGGLRTADAWRRRGLAAFLVGRALQHMAELGARRVTLGTQHDNWAAHATYRRFGFGIADEACAFRHELTP